MSDLDLSILIAAWNEGDALVRTVASCKAACQGIAHEIVVVDDGSTDRSTYPLERLYPTVRLHRSDAPRGTAAPKHQAAGLARGDVLLFLDAHCCLDAAALRRLLEGIDVTQGQAVLVPCLAELDPQAWRIIPTLPYGFGRLNLLTLDYESVRQQLLPSRPPFVETAALAGGCCLMTRSLYFALGGFDPHVPGRSLEDVDFGLRAWLSGFAVLCDPTITVGHWLRPGHRLRYAAPETLANKMRIAYKNFEDRWWKRWRERLTAVEPALWAEAESIFARGLESANERRASNLAGRRRDEVWFARKFGLTWPREAPAVSDVQPL